MRPSSLAATLAASCILLLANATPALAGYVVVKWPGTDDELAFPVPEEGPTGPAFLVVNETFNAAVASAEEAQQDAWAGLGEAIVDTPLGPPVGDALDLAYRSDSPVMEGARATVDSLGNESSLPVHVLTKLRPGDDDSVVGYLPRLYGVILGPLVIHCGVWVIQRDDDDHSTRVDPGPHVVVYVEDEAFAPADALVPFEYIGLHAGYCAKDDDTE